MSLGDDVKRGKRRGGEGCEENRNSPRHTRVEDRVCAVYSQERVRQLSSMSHRRAREESSQLSVPTAQRHLLPLGTTLSIHSLSKLFGSPWPRSKVSPWVRRFLAHGWYLAFLRGVLCECEGEATGEGAGESMRWSPSPSDESASENCPPELSERSPIPSTSRRELASERAASKAWVRRCRGS